MDVGNFGTIKLSMNMTVCCKSSLVPMCVILSLFFSDVFVALHYVQPMHHPADGFLKEFDLEVKHLFMVLIENH